MRIKVLENIEFSGGIIFSGEYSLQEIDMVSETGKTQTVCLFPFPLEGWHIRKIIILALKANGLVEIK